LITKFFNNPNVNSLSKIIAQHINIDSIIEDNILLIDKFAQENEMMKINDNYTVIDSRIQNNKYEINRMKVAA